LTFSLATRENIGIDNEQCLRIRCVTQTAGFQLFWKLIEYPGNVSTVNFPAGIANSQYGLKRQAALL
jgi:hypothetical protein